MQSVVTSCASYYLPIVPGSILICLFSLERIVLRFAGSPIDDVLDELAPAGITAELDAVNVKV